MADIFKRKPLDLKKPITADTCLIAWNDIIVTSATNVTINYQQGVQRRRTLGVNGKNVAIIYPTQPVGTLQIQRLFADTEENIFDRAGWNVCQGLATIRISFTGESSFDGCTVNGGQYACTGALVSGYSISAEAEGLTVVDNINIEFMQLEYYAGT